MQTTDIWFPNMDIYLTNVPKSVTIFGFEVAFYGIIIALGFFFGIALAAHEANRIGLEKDCWWDASVWMILFSIIGARVYYIVFSWDLYKNDLKQVFNLRNGGLAIYGGVLAGIATIVIYAKRHKISPLAMLDCGIFGLLLGQIMGRWGNFFNREVFGGYTNNLFAMRLPVDAVRASDITEELASHIEYGTSYIQVHPTFLYESMGNLLILIILLIYRYYKKFDGEMLYLYFFGYGVLRFIMEGIRTDRLMIGNTNLAVSQVLSGCMIAFAVVMLSINYVKVVKNNVTDGDRRA